MICLFYIFKGNRCYGFFVNIICIFIIQNDINKNTHNYFNLTLYILMDSKDSMDILELTLIFKSSPKCIPL